MQPRSADYFNCMQGLKQGCLVSPVLFSFLINKLALEIVLRGKHGIQSLPRETELFLLMFADDFALLSSTPVGLQNQLNVLYEVANRLGLLVNLEKTKKVVFRNGGCLARAERWYYGSVELVSVASSYKYLGLKFTTKVCLNRISEDSVVRAEQGTVEIFKVLFDAQIVPVLFYGSELWGCFACPNVEKVHIYASKRILGLSSQSPNHMVYGELGRHHLPVLASTRCVKYWLRLNKLSSNRYVRMAYNMLKSMAEEGKEN